MQPRTRARTRLIVALALLVPALLYWGFAGLEPGTPALTPQTEASYDFFIQDAQSRNWNDEGALVRQWQTPRLEHFPQRQGSQVEAPTALLPAARDPATLYKIRANTGWISDQSNAIQLAGDVEVHHNPHSGRAGILTTSEFTLYPERRYGRTDAPASLIRGSDRTDTVGLEVFFDERRVELLSNVRGQYDAP